MQNYTSPITARRYFITGAQRLSNVFWASLIFFGGAGFLLTGFFSFVSRFTPSDELHTNLSFVGTLAEQVFAFLGSKDPGSSLFYRDKALFATLVAKEPIFYTEVARIEANSPLVTNSIRFFPQGLIMCFYGSLGLIFSFYLWSTIFWKVGDGFNEFNKETGVVRIFRWGLPGKDRQISFVYRLKDIEALRILDKEGLNPRRTIALQIKGKGEIPLTRIGEPIPLQEIENQASSLAAFLKVEIEVLSR